MCYNLGTMGDRTNYLCTDEIIDQVVEWLGRQWKTSQIKRSLREIDPNIKLGTIMTLMKFARQKIRVIYHADPNEFKGKAIEFYASIIRGKYSLKYKLTAQQRLDALLGLEHIQIEDPALYAVKIMQALKQMDDSVQGGENESKSIEVNEEVNKVEVGKMPQADTEDTKRDKGSRDTIDEDEPITEADEVELNEELKEVRWPKDVKV